MNLASVFCASRATTSRPCTTAFERPLYHAAGVNPNEEQGWLGYAFALLAFNLAGALVLYALMRLQAVLPLTS